MNDFILFVRDCGWQALIALVLLVQFVMIWRLRRKVRDLERYEAWYHEQSQLAPRSPRASQMLRRR